MKKVSVCQMVVMIAFGAGTVLAQTRPTPLKPGDSIPPFRAVDQAAKERTFRDLRGPKGLVLFFHKSADW